MSNLSMRYIKTALLCLALGICLGASFALDRSIGAWLRPLHAELNVWGWTTLLIYGFGYHMLPRFTGRPLRSPRAAEAQFWLAAGGIALAALGWAGTAAQVPNAWALTAAGATLQFAAAAVFVWLVGELLR